MQEVKIIPIFDETAPDVWADFERIRASAMLTNYNIKVSDQDISARVKLGINDWQRGTHFAFGAFANKKMIGFIQGTAYGRVATVCSLYVIQKFQKQKVGHALLQNAENSVALFTNQIELRSLSRAELFYQSHGYISPYGTNRYIKTKIQIPCCQCVPVFKCNRAMESKIQTLDSSFTAATVNKQHVPVFVYLNAERQVIGCAVNDKIFVEPHCGIQNAVTNSLRRNISKVR